MRSIYIDRKPSNEFFSSPRSSRRLGDRPVGCRRFFSFSVAPIFSSFIDTRKKMAKSLSEAQQQELKEVFDTFDAGIFHWFFVRFHRQIFHFFVDRSGMISSGELSRIFKALNLKISQSEVDRFVSLMDSNGSGSFDFSTLQFVERFVQVTSNSTSSAG